ncbi:MAG TPA: pentapeptide repeat-containing protein [Myxococcota bacterium]|nr:pentapeptide repeat-containing protein [Myxococcota bacterium]
MGTQRPLTKKNIAEMLSRGQPLAYIDLRGTDLSGLCFDNADLTSAKLAFCNLARATFRNANLRLASLWHADCKDAVFDGAVLEEADLDLSNLDGATFKNARIKKTTFPNGRVAMEEIEKSIKTGRRVVMTRTAGE